MILKFLFRQKDKVRGARVMSNAGQSDTDFDYQDSDTEVSASYN